MSNYSYFCSTGFGLYRCPDWNYGSSVPTWEHIGQTRLVDEFTLDLNDPDEFQACQYGGAVYVRRPTFYGDDDWVEVYTVADAVAQFGPPNIQDFGWVEISSAIGKEGRMYIQAHTGLNTDGKKIYMLKSEDYGATWSLGGQIVTGIIRNTGGIWAGRVTGDTMYASYSAPGLVAGTRISYSTDEGTTWYEKDTMGGSLWVTRVMIDPSDEGMSFAGQDIDGPELVRSFAAANGYGGILNSNAGLAIYYGYGGGWISAWNGNYVRTIRQSTYYYADDRGDTTFTPVSVSNRGRNATFERAMWGRDTKPWEVGVASRLSIDLPTSNYHLLKSTRDNGGTWYDKAGANASTATTGGGDSIPYNCGGIAENGLYLIIPGRVFTSVVAMQALPTSGTVYADGVQMGTLATGSTVYAHGVEQESPRQT